MEIDALISKGVAILGSTGSIGRNALDVIEGIHDQFRVVGLTANQNAEDLLEQCERFDPLAVVLGNGADLSDFHPMSDHAGLSVLRGLPGIIEVACMPEADIVLNALVGSVGLKPTLEALRLGKRVALANKETLVMGGDLVMKTARESGGEIIPVDSEHSAIFQVLNGRPRDSIDSIILTASGGPFRTYSMEKLRNITVSEALNHPVWQMGNKITIDSASLANKGLEVIEAHYLFDIEYDRIEVVIHPQSVIHSMVRFTDGSIIAQLGVPDMKLPIQYALTYPDRIPRDFNHSDLVSMSPLTFESVSEEVFPVLSMAYRVGKRGGSAPAVFNAANEEAARGFLAEKLPFHRIPEIIEQTIEEHPFSSEPDLEDLLEIDLWARKRAEELIC
jgi:1-deoxy-D-xylulose-5-phosphate reductoisomerase